MPDKELMTCATGGCGWWGYVGPVRTGDEYSVQKLLERYEIREGCYNAGSHNGFLIEGARRKHWRRIWPSMRKGQISKRAHDMNIEHSIAKRLWHIVRVCYWRLMRIDHDVDP
jgi:hypothetical protein